MAEERTLSSLIAELAGGGLLIVDRFPDRTDDQVAFRTLVQLDGDVSVSIHADALARRDFAELLEDHATHVRAVLSEKGTRLRRMANALIALSMLFGVAGGGGAGTQIGDVTLLIMQIPGALVPYATASLGALLFWAIASASLRTILRRWAFGSPTLRE